MLKCITLHIINLLLSEKKIKRIEQDNDSIKFYIEQKTTKEIFADKDRQRIEKMKALIPDFTNVVILN